MERKYVIKTCARAIFVQATYFTRNKRTQPSFCNVYKLFYLFSHWWPLLILWSVMTNVFQTILVHVYGTVPVATSGYPCTSLTNMVALVAQGRSPGASYIWIRLKNSFKSNCLTCFFIIRFSNTADWRYYCTYHFISSHNHLLIWNYVSQIMTVCGQQRCWSPCAFEQSDQCLCYSLPK